MLWVRTQYFLRTAWSGIRTSPITSVIGAVTIGISLLLLGAFALLVENMEGVLDKLSDELFVTAYLEEGLSAEEEQALEDAIRTHRPSVRAAAPALVEAVAAGVRGYF